MQLSGLDDDEARTIGARGTGGGALLEKGYAAGPPPVSPEPSPMLPSTQAEKPHRAQYRESRSRMKMRKGT